MALYKYVYYYYYYYSILGRSSRGRLKLGIAKQGRVRYSVRAVNGRQRIVQQNGIETIDVKTFLRFFKFWSRFLRFFCFPDVFYLKKRWQSSERQAD